MDEDVEDVLRHAVHKSVVGLTARCAVNQTSFDECGAQTTELHYEQVYDCLGRFLLDQDLRRQQREEQRLLLLQQLAGGRPD